MHLTNYRCIENELKIVHVDITNFGVYLLSSLMFSFRNKKVIGV